MICGLGLISRNSRAPESAVLPVACAGIRSKLRFGEKNNHGEIAMEMHSRRSLYESHGITTLSRRRSRWGTIARCAITRLRALMKGGRAAIEAELAAHHDIAEIARMSDYMLRDIGITRSEIESRVRRPRASVGIDDEPVRSNDAGQNPSALPTINSPDLVSQGRSERG
ncbi:DUF1127 domain-containing protein [Bradyrhizobium sp. UFLA05-109]